MNINLKSLNNRYTFDVLGNQGQIIYSSDIHYFLTPFVQSSYKYAWEACRDAWKLALNRNYHIASESTQDYIKPIMLDVSAEQMLINHYLDIFNGLRLKAKGVDNDKEREKVYQETKIVISELETIVEKITNHKDKRKINLILSRYQKLMRRYFKDKQDKDEIKTAGVVSKEIDEEIKAELLGDYAQKICKAIQNKHRDLYYVINGNVIVIKDFNNECLLKITVNDFLNIKDIVPCGKLKEIYPFYSVAFYQKYWKPIVEKLNHFCVEDYLVKVEENLPDIANKEETYILSAWNIKEKRKGNINVSFKGEMWLIEPSQNVKMASSISKHNEQDYINAIVKCIDPQLKSITGRTGTVMQLIPHEDFIEIDVNFGRGLGVVRLIENQIEIVPV